MPISQSMRNQFSSLFKVFLNDYPSSESGKAHRVLYTDAREAAKANYQEIVAADQRGEDITELVLLKLLPYSDTANNRARGAWIHWAPSINGNIHKWYESAGWIDSHQWPEIAQAIWNFVERCNAEPDQYQHACTEFAGKVNRGFQTGTLTPILNALHPAKFALINNKSRSVINYLCGTNYGGNLTEYPAVNVETFQLVEELSEYLSETALGISPADQFDMFCHWLVAVHKFKFQNISFWKISPGREAWHWDECREGNFISIGWDEFGDLSQIDRAGYEERRKVLASEHNWTDDGVEQLWIFAKEIREGDQIIANRGTTTLLGSGIVTGPYYFVEGVRHGHRLPVEWIDTTQRQINQGGWRRTLMRLNQETFEALQNAPAVDAPSAYAEDDDSVGGSDTSTSQKSLSPFSKLTFELLEQLHLTPTASFYLENKNAFVSEVEKPFQRIMQRVAAQLPPSILEVMETKKRLFGRVLKNDFGQGGAWPFYWGAFYPKGSKRSQDAQLSVWMNYQFLECGFYIGDYGSQQRRRFLRNCELYHEHLTTILDMLAAEQFHYGSVPEQIILSGSKPVRRSADIQDWRDFLADPNAYNCDVSVVFPRSSLLQISEDALVEQIATVHKQLFPLVLLAISDDPLTAIAEYLDIDADDGNEEEQAEPPYTITSCAADTGYSEDILQEWIDAIEYKGQAILYGPPGTGKTYMAQCLAKVLRGNGDGFIDLVQFHPAYAYEDFIQGIRPQTTGEGQLVYQTVPGRFLEFCRKAQKHSGTCVLIIDEINRANLSRVFGELMYLLEYREKEIPLAGGGRLQIPKNVRILGTMNTADRSIALVDHALRRRFVFIALQPNLEYLRIFHNDPTDAEFIERLIQVLKRLNQGIQDRHYAVGTSYFLRQDLRNSLPSIWRMEIEPYLEEYFFAQPDRLEDFRWQRIRLELGV
jgi:5-methylcytosine-specific restriction protein B